MFKATIMDPAPLRDSMDTISQIIGEGLFKISKDGIALTAADRATIVVVDFEMKSSCFEEYLCDKDESIGLNIENFLQILRRADKGDKLTLSLEENKLFIKMEGNTRRKFSMPLLEIAESEVPSLEQLNFPATLQIKTLVFEKGLDDAGIVADNVILEADENGFTIKTEEDANSMEMKLQKDSEGLIDIDAKEPVRSRYSLEYLKKMMKAGKISDVLTLKMGKDYPIKMIFSQPDKVSMTFVLAPRVEE